VKPVVQNRQLAKEPGFIINIKASGNYKVLNIIDEELIGKKLTEGSFSLYLDPRYFLGEKVYEMQLKDLILNNSIINLVGNRSVEFALKMGFGTKESVRVIDGVSFLIIYKFTDNY